MQLTNARILKEFKEVIVPQCLLLSYDKADKGKAMALWVQYADRLETEGFINSKQRTSLEVEYTQTQGK